MIEVLTPENKQPYLNSALLKDIQDENLIIPENTKDVARAHISQAFKKIHTDLEQNPLKRIEDANGDYSLGVSTKTILGQVEEAFNTGADTIIGGGFSRSGKSKAADFLTQYVNENQGNAVTYSLQSIGVTPNVDSIIFSVLAGIKDRCTQNQMTYNNGQQPRPLDIVFLDETAILRKRQDKFDLAQLINTIRHFYPETTIVTIDVFYKNWRTDKEGVEDKQDVSKLMPKAFLQPTIDSLREMDYKNIVGVEYIDCSSLSIFRELVDTFVEPNIPEEQKNDYAQEVFAFTGGNIFLAKALINSTRKDKSRGSIKTDQLSQGIQKLRKVNLRRSLLENPMNKEENMRIFKEEQLVEDDKILDLYLTLDTAFSGYPNPLVTLKHVRASLSHSKGVDPNLALLGNGPQKGVFKD